MLLNVMLIVMTAIMMMMAQYKTHISIYTTNSEQKFRNRLTYLHYYTLFTQVTCSRFNEARRGIFCILLCISPCLYYFCHTIQQTHNFRERLTISKKLRDNYQKTTIVTAISSQYSRSYQNNSLHGSANSEWVSGASILYVALSKLP